MDQAWQLVIMNWAMNSDVYNQILHEHIDRSITKLKPNSLIQQDNNPEPQVVLPKSENG